MLKVLNQREWLFFYGLGNPRLIKCWSGPVSTEGHISLLSWPSCLCFAPEFAPNVHLLLQPWKSNRKPNYFSSSRTERHSPLAPNSKPQREPGLRGQGETAPVHWRPLDRTPRPHHPLTASPARPSPWRARRACPLGPPVHPAGVARVASGPRSSDSLQRTGGSLPTWPSPSRLFQFSFISVQNITEPLASSVSRGVWPSWWGFHP